MAKKHAPRYAVIAVILSLFAFSIAAQPEQTVEVQSPVRVSEPNSGAYFWWTLAASPSDPNTIVLCGLRNRESFGEAWQAVAYGSLDGGESWRNLFVDASSQVVSEAGCALSNHQTVYFMASTALGFSNTVVSAAERRNRLERMHLRRSVDFGQTWQLAPLGQYADNVQMVVQPGTDPDHDRVTIFADGLNREMIVSRDGTRSLGRGVLALPDIAHSARNKIVWTGGAATLPDGTIGALYTDRQPSGTTGNATTLLTLSKVRANGIAIGRPVVIARISTAMDIGKAGIDGFLAYRLPSLAVDSKSVAVRKRTYAAWHDWVRNRMHILLAYSDNSGVTWSRPRTIDDVPQISNTERDSAPSHPSLAVNSNGVVGVQWAEFDGRCWRFAASYDAGLSFARSVALNTCSAHPLSFSNHLAGYLFSSAAARDPTGSTVVLRLTDWRLYNAVVRGTSLVAGTDGGFYASWVPLTNGDDALYVARVDIGGSPQAQRRRRVVQATFSETPALRSPHGLVAWIDYTNLNYDEATGEFTVGAVLVTRHRASPRWPLVFSAQNLKSVLGSVSALNADNGRKKTRAAWVFDGPAGALPARSSAVLDRTLPTSERFEYSKPRQLRFRLDSRPHDPRVPRGYGWTEEILTVRGSVLVAP